MKRYYVIKKKGRNLFYDGYSKRFTNSLFEASKFFLDQAKYMVKRNFDKKSDFYKKISPKSALEIKEVKLILCEEIKNKKSCKHKNQEKIDYGTNICKDCRRLVSTLKTN